jgi:hypothetical protein
MFPPQPTPKGSRNLLFSINVVVDVEEVGPPGIKVIRKFSLTFTRRSNKLKRPSLERLSRPV